jgi:hypothetical protein
MAVVATGKKGVKKAPKVIVNVRAPLTGKGPAGLAKPVVKANNGLRKPQVEILKALKGGNSMTRPQLAAKSKVDISGFTGLIGSYDDEKRKHNDANWGYTCLITLGYVRLEIRDVEGKDTPMYSITAKGKAALAKIG